MRRWDCTSGYQTTQYLRSEHPLSLILTLDTHPDTTFSYERKLFAPDGKVYVWEKRQSTNSLKAGKIFPSSRRRLTPRRVFLQLVEYATRRSVAKAHNAHHFIDQRQMSVDFEPALASILDALVLSFIICEEKRRRQRRQRAGVAGTTAGFAAGAV